MGKQKYSMGTKCIFPNCEMRYGIDYGRLVKGLCVKHYRTKMPVEKLKQWTKEYNDRCFELILNHYGAYCHCCGETNTIFLTLSHIDNDGAKHRKELHILGGGGALWSWLVRNNFQTNYKLTIECYNCNMSRSRNKGICPHTIMEVIQ